MWQKAVRVLKLWPIAAAIYFITGFNLIVIFAWLKALGINGLTYWLTGIACSELELCFWYWFFGWGPRMLRDADVVQALIDDFKTEGFPGEFRDLAQHAKMVTQDSWNWLKPRILRHSEAQEGGRVDRMAGVVHKSLLPVGYFLIYLLGSWPTVNTLVGVPLCRIVRLRFAFVALMLGNVNTVFVSGGIVELVFWLWRSHPVALMVTVLIGIVGILLYECRKRHNASGSL